MVQVDEAGHAEILIPVCPWCDKPLDGPNKNGMHEACYEEYVAESNAGYDKLASGWIGS
jgi:hypothetical protein